MSRIEDIPSGSRYPPHDESHSFVDPALREDESNTASTNDKFPKRIPGACEHCRSKKLRCEVTRPCKRCMKDGLDCRAVPKVVRTPLSRNNMTLFQARTEMDDMFWGSILPNYRYRLDQMGERLSMVGLDAMREELIRALQVEAEGYRYPTHPDISRTRSRSPRPEAAFQTPQDPQFPIDPSLTQSQSQSQSQPSDPSQPHPPLTLADLNFPEGGDVDLLEGGGKEGEKESDDLEYLGPLARRILNNQDGRGE